MSSRRRPRKRASTAPASAGAGRPRPSTRPAGRGTGRPASRGAKPAPPPPAPAPTGLRGRIEGASRPLLVRIHRLPRWLVVIVMVALLSGGMLAPGPIGAACLGVVVVFLAWLTYLAWPEGGAGRQVMRVLALVLAAGAAVLRAVQG